MEIWTSQVTVATEAVSKANISTDQIAGIGITNQRETTILWDRNTGKAIYNAIVWQDRRTSAYCNELKAKGLSELISSKTGLIIDAYLSASKIKWILDNVKFVLIFVILYFTPAAMGDQENTPVGLGSLGAIPVAFLVWGIGLSLGSTTGYAINPARDLGPRLVHWILPIRGKGHSDWPYSWVPVLGPLIGAALAAFAFLVIQP